MKKTLIALAVAASAAVSGSAMAWTANGTGGSVDMGGTLNPVTKVTPWEVKTGDAVTDLDAQIQRGQRVVDVVVNRAIPVLGIRVADAVNKTFIGGQPDIVPQIDYHGAVDTNAFNANVAPMNLKVKNDQNQEIGTMVVDMFAYGESSWDGVYAGKKRLFANNAGHAFFGGLGHNNQSVSGNGVFDRVAAIDSGFVANYTNQNAQDKEPGVEDFSGSDRYSAFYGSGIEQGKVITLTLNSPAQGDASIIWRASLPVTVSYR
ncbi:hypothetical protein ACVQZN_004323 [Escherichia coli]